MTLTITMKISTDLIKVSLKFSQASAGDLAISIYVTISVKREPLGRKHRDVPSVRR